MVDYYDKILATISIILSLSFILYLLTEANIIIITGGFLCFSIIFHALFIDKTLTQNNIDIDNKPL